MPRMPSTGLDPSGRYYTDRGGLPFYQTPNINDVRWDENGNPIGLEGPPQGDAAYQFQFQAEMRARQRQAALWGDAQNQMNQGLRLFQSYRPGGSAALASGFFQHSADLYAQQAQGVTAPDLLAERRKQAIDSANRYAGKNERFSKWISGINTAVSLIGAVSGAGVATGGGYTPSNQSDIIEQPGYAPATQGGKPPPAVGGGVPYGGAQTPWSGADVGNFNQGMQGAMRPAGGGGLGPGGIGPPLPLTSNARLPGEGGTPTNAQQPQRGGQQGGLVARTGGPGGPSGGLSGTGGPGGMGLGLSGGLGQDGMFTNTAMASSAMRASPAVEAVVTLEQEQDPMRRATTAWMVRSSLQRLAEAG